MFGPNCTLSTILLMDSEQKEYMMEVLSALGISTDNLDDSSEDCASDMYYKYKDKPLLFNLVPYLLIPQATFFRDLVYYRSVIEKKVRPILWKLTVDELFEERHNISFKMNNTWTVYPTNATPKTHPHANFELPQRLYKEFINETLNEKLYPKATLKSLFNEFCQLVRNSTDRDLKFSSITDDKLVVISTNQSKWIAQLIKYEGEYIWKVKDQYCTGFRCSHYQLMLSKGELFKDMVQNCINH